MSDGKDHDLQASLTADASCIYRQCWLTVIRTWNFPCYFRILRHVSFAKCGSYTENSKLHCIKGRRQNTRSCHHTGMQYTLLRNHACGCYKLYSTMSDLCRHFMRPFVSWNPYVNKTDWNTNCLSQAWVLTLYHKFCFTPHPPLCFIKNSSICGIQMR